MRRTLPPSRPRARHSHPSPPRLDALRVLTLELCVCLLPLLLRLPTSTRARRGLLVELVPRRECLALGGADSIMHAELERPGRGGRRVHVHPGHVRNGPLRVRAERPVGQARRDHHRRGDGHREDDAYPDAFLPHTDNMDNMAIVFHCNTRASERAFCAKIQYTQYTAPTWRPSWPTAPR